MDLAIRGSLGGSHGGSGLGKPVLGIKNIQEESVSTYTQSYCFKFSTPLLQSQSAHYDLSSRAPEGDGQTFTVLDLIWRDPPSPMIASYSIHR